MESLLYKPTYKYSINSRSKIIYNQWSNSCFISSFQIQMKKLYTDFPDLDELLNLLYNDTFNAYTHFANDFPKKWYQIKQYLISNNLIWLDRLDNIVLRICLPTSIKDKCVLVSFIDLNAINISLKGQCYYDSLEKALSDKVSNDKKIINILQLQNHFEPIEIISNSELLTDLNLVSKYKSFLT